jgi:hypothetical protein
MTCAVRYAVASVSDDNAASIITDAGGTSFFFEHLWTTHHATVCHNPEDYSVNLLTRSLRINWALQQVITHVDFHA